MNDNQSSYNTNINENVLSYEINISGQFLSNFNPNNLSKTDIGDSITIQNLNQDNTCFIAEKIILYNNSEFRSQLWSIIVLFTTIKKSQY